MFTKFLSRDIPVASVALMLVAFAAALFFSGCGEDSNPIVDTPETEEDAPYHAEADGFLLEVDGVEIYRQFQGTETGGIAVGVGEEIDVHVQFLNPDGVGFIPQPEEEAEHEGEDDGHAHDEEEFALGLTGYDTAIAEVHLHVEEHEEDEHGHVEEHEEDTHEEEEEKWVFEVVGVKAGTTHITLQLLHGDHPDFTAALPIPITVQ